MPETERTPRIAPLEPPYSPEIEAALPSDEAKLICQHFSVKPEGNVSEANDPFKEFVGKNILIQKATLRDTALAVGCGLQEASDRLVAGLERLRAVRSAFSWGRSRCPRHHTIVPMSCPSLAL